jgi:hypothetical protein
MDPTDPDPQHCNQERVTFFVKNKPEVFLVKVFGLLAGAKTASRHDETATWNQGTILHNRYSTVPTITYGEKIKNELDRDSDYDPGEANQCGSMGTRIRITD